MTNARRRQSPRRKRSARRRGRLLLVLAVVAAAAFGGYTVWARSRPLGSNGVAAKPAAEIVETARRQADAASSVRLSGTVASGRTAFRLDMRLAPGGARGRVSYGKRTFELLRVGDALYLKANGALYEGSGGASPSPSAGASGTPAASAKPSPSSSSEAAAGDSAVRTLRDKYVKVPSGDPLYAELTRFTDKPKLLAEVLVLHGTPERVDGSGGPVNGRETVAVRADGGRGGTLQVAVDGRPYPLRYRRASAAGTLDLTEFGRAVPLAEPPASEIVAYPENPDGAKKKP